jgi:hypothetical protein
VVADTGSEKFVESVDYNSFQLAHLVANLHGLMVLTVHILNKGSDIPEVVESVQNTVAALEQQNTVVVGSRQCMPVVVVVVEDDVVVVAAEVVVDQC